MKIFALVAWDVDNSGGFVLETFDDYADAENNFDIYLRHACKHAVDEKGSLTGETLQRFCIQRAAIRGPGAILFATIAKHDRSARPSQKETSATA